VGLLVVACQERLQVLTGTRDVCRDQFPLEFSQRLFHRSKIGSVRRHDGTFSEFQDAPLAPSVAGSADPQRQDLVRRKNPAHHPTTDPATAPANTAAPTERSG
jgi:hypothetical protein